MTNRFHMYRDIHKGVRMLLSDLVVRAGTTDFADRAQAADLCGRVEEGFDFLEDHAKHENGFVVPLLEARCPELAARNAAEHLAHDSGFASAREKLARAVSTGSAAEGHAFVLALSRIASELLEHMADEEEVIMPALWAAYTDDELLAAHGALLASLSPAEMMHSVGLMLPAMNGRERIDFVAGMRMGAPPPVVTAVLDLARERLSRGEFEALSRGLDALAA